MATSKNQRTSKKTTAAWEQKKVKTVKEVILVANTVLNNEDDVTRDEAGEALTYKGKEVIGKVYKFGRWYFKVKNV